MRKAKLRYSYKSKELSTILSFVLTGIIVGLAIGFFKKVIGVISTRMIDLISLVKDRPIYALGIIILFIIIGTFIYFLSKKDPNINGSGIPIIYGMLDNEFTVDSPRTLIRKFIASTLAIGSGLTLGREGPSVQIGGLIGDIVHKVTKSKENKRYFIGSAAGAGIAVAFNAPIAGMLFTVEEIFKKTDREVFLSTAITIFTAIITADIAFGNHPALLDVPHFEVMRLSMIGILIVLGIFVGLSGVFFNFCVIGSKGVFKKININPYIKYLIPFVVTAIVLMIDIDLFASSEDFIFLATNGETSLLKLIIFYFMKIFLLSLAFGAGVSGGSLVPLLVIGSLVGNIVGTSLVMAGLLDPSFIFVFSILGMCGHFSAIVRAPITAIILVLEMTGGAFEYLLGISIVSLIAYSIAEICKSKPFYEHLYELMLKKA
ncbi:ClC family H(+)/Cl(-) exchange transporter [Anaerococcus sp.]|uniref:ClC family H(+)/Cl(-) exchange transporter n=1 Tax=Anaerococcus sp. TaxID=1872515 RepID=UPI0027BAF8E9|nr:ClC family H(+)/Cl(-) exchange transporter [Anaerococcus sp.]